MEFVNRREFKKSGLGYLYKISLAVANAGSVERRFSSLTGLRGRFRAHAALHEHAVRRDVPGGSGARQEEAVGGARHPGGAQQGLPGDALRHLHRFRLTSGQKCSKIKRTPYFTVRAFSLRYVLQTLRLTSSLGVLKTVEFRRNRCISIK